VPLTSTSSTRWNLSGIASKDPGQDVTIGYSTRLHTGCRTRFHAIGWPGALSTRLNGTKLFQFSLESQEGQSKGSHGDEISVCESIWHFGNERGLRLNPVPQTQWFTCAGIVGFVILNPPFRVFLLDFAADGINFEATFIDHTKTHCFQGARHGNCLRPVALPLTCGDR
jgi:hypothetical protein